MDAELLNYRFSTFQRELSESRIASARDVFMSLLNIESKIF